MSDLEKPSPGQLWKANESIGHFAFTKPVGTGPASTNIRCASPEECFFIVEVDPIPYTGHGFYNPMFWDVKILIDERLFAVNAVTIKSWNYYFCRAIR